jgi:hypothetical protein
MTDAKALTRRQLRRLQTLWSLFWAHRVRPFLASGAEEEGGSAYQRQLRLGWVAGRLGLEQLDSFKSLTAAQAAGAIEALQKELPPELVTRKPKTGRRPGRDLAQAMGTAGRRTSHSPLATRHSKVERLPDSMSWGQLDKALGELGWTRAQLDAFLRSPRSPIRPRTAILTLGDLNRALWALRQMARRKKRNPAVPGCRKNLRQAKNENRKASPVEVTA